MTVTYTIILSDAENKALGAVTESQNEWIQNVVKNRCRIAIEEIVTSEVERITAEGGTISGTKDDIVLAAQLKSAEEKHKEMLESLPKL